MTWDLLLVQLAHATAEGTQNSLPDIVAALASVALIEVVFFGHAVAFFGEQKPSVARLSRETGGVLLGRRMMHAGYWFLQPLGAALSRLNVSPNTVTAVGLLLTALGSLSIMSGHLGLAGAALLAAALCDAMDGMVARLEHTASRSGAFFDALSDRTEEILIFGGLAAAGYRSPLMVVLSLLALLGSLMNSYVSAKAEVYRADIPNGRMRRGERAAWVILACIVSPLLGACLAPFGWGVLATAPVMLAAAVVGFGSSLSAGMRAWALLGNLRVRDGATTPSRAGLERPGEAESCRIHRVAPSLGEPHHEPTLP